MSCPKVVEQQKLAYGMPMGQKPGDNEGAAITTACLSQQGYEDISNSVRGLLRSLPDTCNEHDCPRADWAGCVLRMTGHDFMDFDGFRGGSDACTDMEDPDNSGLLECLATGEFGISLQDSYSQFRHSVSLADFLVIAAEAVITETRMWAVADRTGDFNSGAVDIDFKSVFLFGRTTAIDFCTFTEGRLPNPE